MEARAAESLLASSLVGAEELDELLEGICNIGARKKTDKGMRLGTSVTSLDGALGGRLLGARVVGVWGHGMIGSEVSVFLS